MKMSLLDWDDPELDHFTDEMLDADYEVLDLDPEVERERKADAALRVRPHGFTDEGEDW